MIDNYLVDARQRFDMENELKAKQKQEQIELHEKLKREIYLNGGFVDCVNPGCVDQGTAETSYLCKPCFKEQTLGRTQQQNNTARFYSIIPPASMPSNNGPVVTFRREDQQTHARSGHAHQLTHAGNAHAQQLTVNKQLTCPSPTPVQAPPPPVATVGHIVPVVATPPVAPMRVKLPSPTPASHPCRNKSCEFYGTPELDYFCSKCSKNNVNARIERWLIFFVTYLRCKIGYNSTGSKNLK